MDMGSPACDIFQARFEIAGKRRFLDEIRAIADGSGTHIIFFDADAVAGREHVEAALRHAWRSYVHGTPIANSFEMEALLFAAGTRQCSAATGFGIHEGENRAYICICPPSAAAADRLGALVTYVEEDWEMITPEDRERLMALFSVTPEEVEAVGVHRFRELVIERVALLEVYR